MPEPVVDPLWSLMLSTNDCYPGCACDDDRFQITPDRIGAWIVHNGIDAASVAFTQLVSLRSDPSFDSDALSQQTNLWWDDADSALDWLAEWHSAISDSIAQHQR